MAWPENYTITKVYWKNYIDKYFDVYESVYNRMKELYDDEQALAAAVATTMIAFSKAAGMDMTGVVTWDETLAEQTDFNTFAEPKSASTTPGQTNVSGFQKSGTYQKKPYNGPTELKGPASEKQVNKIHEFLNDNDAKVQKIVAEALAELNVAAPEELGKQDASNIIQMGFDAKKKAPYKK